MSAYGTAQALSVAELWKLQAQRTKLMAAYLERWKKAGIDGILSKIPFPFSPLCSLDKVRSTHTMQSSGLACFLEDLFADVLSPFL